jgi:hypothetical protein
MPQPTDPARDLLFGLLALQNGLIDQGGSEARVRFDAEAISVCSHRQPGPGTQISCFR